MSSEIHSRLERIEALLVQLVGKPPSREFYTVDQAAERLRLAPWTVRNRCRLGDILAEKDRSGQWLIHRDEIERLEDNRHRLD